MQRPQFNFLGAGSAALAMYIDILYTLYGRDIALQIIENVKVDDPTPYLIEGMHCQKIFHDEWTPKNDDSFILGVNKPGSKAAVFNYFKENYGIHFKNYQQLIHPSAVISVTANLFSGVVINPGVVVAPFTTLGNLVSVNRNVSVGHHTSIGDFCTLQPEANVAGKCNIGGHVTIGMGATIIDGISIGKNSIIGAGSLVTKDLPEGVVAYGVPAKIVRKVEA